MSIRLPRWVCEGRGDDRRVTRFAPRLLGIFPGAIPGRDCLSARDALGGERRGASTPLIPWHTLGTNDCNKRQQQPETSTEKGARHSLMILRLALPQSAGRISAQHHKWVPDTFSWHLFPFLLFRNEPRNLRLGAAVVAASLERAPTTQQTSLNASDSRHGIEKEVDPQGMVESLLAGRGGHLSRVRLPADRGNRQEKSAIFTGGPHAPSGQSSSSDLFFPFRDAQSHCRSRTADPRLQF